MYKRQDFTQHFGAVTSLSIPDLPPPGVGPTAIPIVVNVPGYGNVEFQVTRSGGIQPSAPFYVTRVGDDFTNEVNDPIYALNFSHQTEVAVSFIGDVAHEYRF